MTTFHNGNALVDGAFKEEEQHEPGLSQSINLNNVLNQTNQLNLKGSQDTDLKAAPIIVENRDSSPSGLNARLNTHWQQD